MRAGAPLTMILIGAIASAGCGAVVSLDRAVLAYDRRTADTITELLLLNIARARNNEPMHFTGIASITATYRYTFGGGAGPAATGDKGWLILPTLGASVEENPTISIAPMQGEEFTQRLLTPFEGTKLTLLLRQGYDVDALLRLLGAEVHLRNASAVTVHANRPSAGDGYRTFRRVVAHLSAIQDLHGLYVEPLHFEYVWTVPEAAVTPEAYLTTFKDFSLARDDEKHVYQVTRRVNGRVMITNYDPSVLSNQELFVLHGEAEGLPITDVLIDIRAGYPGGDMPLHGALRLRSFHEVLTFVGRGIKEEPEYAVAPDPRSPPISENPVHTLEIVESVSASGSGPSVSLGGRHYSVRTQPGYQWNQKAFNILAQLFQMTMSTTPQAGPAITISK